MRGGSLTRSKSKKEGVFLHGLLPSPKRARRHKPRPPSPRPSPPRPSPPRPSPPRLSPPRTSPPRLLNERITELEKAVEKCNREKRILEEAVPRSPRSPRSPRLRKSPSKSPKRPDCIDTINSFKDDECDAKIHSFTNEQFQSFLQNVTKQDNREVLTIVHKYKKLRSDIYKDLAYFKSNQLSTLFKINKHRADRGLPLEPTDFLSFYEFEMRKRSMVAALPKKTSPKKPSPKKTSPKKTSPNKLLVAATKLPPSRLGLQLGPVAIDVSDHDAVRRKIISLRQAQKSKGLSLKEARESFREIVPESNSHYDTWSSYLNIEKEVPEEI